MLCDAGEFLDVTLGGEFSEVAAILDGSFNREILEITPYGSGVCIACPRDTYQPENATDTPSCVECPQEAPRNLITGSTSASDCVYGLFVQSFM